MEQEDTRGKSLRFDELRSPKQEHTIPLIDPF
jgi:hypothetical protein